VPVFDERSFATISFSLLSFIFGDVELPATRPREGSVLRSSGGRRHPDRLRVPTRRNDDDDVLVLML